MFNSTKSCNPYFIDENPNCQPPILPKRPIMGAFIIIWNHFKMGSPTREPLHSPQWTDSVSWCQGQHLNAPRAVHAILLRMVEVLFRNRLFVLSLVLTHGGLPSVTTRRHKSRHAIKRKRVRNCNDWYVYGCPLCNIILKLKCI